MTWILALFVVAEIPVLFLYQVSTQLLRRHPRPHRMPRFLALAFPTLLLGAVGLPLWAAWRLLGG